MDTGDEKTAEDWTIQEVMEWIEKKRPGMLTEDDREAFLMNCINGETFLLDGNERFFKECGILPGKAMTLARWSRELAKKSKLLSFGVMHTT